METIVILIGNQQDLSSKDKELQDAYARSHAATVSHARRRLEGSYPRKKSRREYGKLSKHLGAARDFTASRQIQQEHETSPEPEEVPPSPPNRSLITLLSESRHDPFNADPFRELTILAQNSLEHAYLNIMPKFDYTLTPARYAALVLHWRSTAVQSPLTFHAHVSNAVSLCYSIASDAEVKTKLLQLRLKHQVLTMRIIREQIQTLRGPADDDLLENLLRIASQGGDLHEGPSGVQYPETPLADAMLLKLYSHFELGLPHWRAIVELVSSRGGIEEISKNFSRRIVLSDVVVSSRLGFRPVFPVLRDMRTFSDNHQFSFDGIAAELFALSEMGWKASMIAESYPELVIIAIRAARLTAAVDQSYRHGKGGLPYFVLCGLATIYQHDLNQFNPANEDTFDEEILPGDIFHVVRLAIQIFSNLVLFPLSQGWAAKPRLRTDMKRALIAYGPLLRQPGPKDNEDYPDSASLILWSLVMGTIISEGTQDRYWYVRKLIHLVGKMEFEFESWIEFRGILVKYLWWDYMFDDHAKDIWDEIWGMERQMRLEY